jgi:hypothetical protein
MFEDSSRRLKARNAINFTRRLETNLDLYQAGQISFAELDASAQGWINHVRHGDTWGLRRHIFNKHAIRSPPRIDLLQRELERRWSDAGKGFLSILFHKMQEFWLLAGKTR